MTQGLGFEHPFFLLLLLAVAAVFWVRIRRRPPALAVSTLGPIRAAGTGWRVRLRPLPAVFMGLGLAALVVAMARPQRVDQELISGEGIDIMIALDMSGSMNAIDLADEEIDALQRRGEEPANRFVTAVRILKGFVRERRSDRIGLVIFGPEAYLRFPPTLDYMRLLNALDGLVLDDGRRSAGGEEDCGNQCTISGNGTNIGDAINRAWMRLEGSNARSKMIILITDGKQEGAGLDPLTVPKYIASLPVREQVRIYTFQVGSGRDTKLPAVDPLRGSVLRDRFGRLVYQRPDRPFPTDPELLRRIATLTGGTFYESYDPKKFENDFRDLERTTFQARVHTNRQERFLPWLLAGLVLLGLGWLLQLTVLRTFPE
jgi:Ca-activated chloride channel family protein